MKNIQLAIQDIFGEYDEEFRSEILSIYRMPFPHAVELHFPNTLIHKMERVQIETDNLKLSSVDFGLTLKEDVVRPISIPLDAQGKVIPIVRYEEYGKRDTLNEFTLNYKWFYGTFQARLIYATSWAETVFYTDRFKLSDVLNYSH